MLSAQSCLPPRANRHAGYVTDCRSGTRPISAKSMCSAVLDLQLWIPIVLRVLPLLPPGSPSAIGGEDSSEPATSVPALCPHSSSCDECIVHPSPSSAVVASAQYSILYVSVPRTWAVSVLRSHACIVSGRGVSVVTVRIWRRLDHGGV